MGCNCGKKRQPLGMTNGKGQKGTEGTAKQTGQTQRFVLTETSGKTQTFGSRLEAEAARIRKGRAGTITVVLP